MERILQFCLIMGNDLKPYDSFNCYFRESSVHPSVHYETRLILVRIIRVLDPNSACIGRERGICPGHVTNPLQFEKLSTVFQDCFVVQSVRLLINTYPGRVSSRPTDQFDHRRGKINLQQRYRRYHRIIECCCIFFNPSINHLLCKSCKRLTKTF